MLADYSVWLKDHHQQAPKQWHENFNTTLTSMRFIVNEVDKCVYYRYGGGDGVILCF
jgi:hypothetical protein